MDNLELIPDPKDEHVWENLRRILEWAQAQQPAINRAWQLLLMGS